MTQKPAPQPCSPMRTGDKSGDIGHDKGLELSVGDHAEVGYESGKGVIRYFRTRSRYPSQQGRFPNIRVTNEAYICEELKLQSKPPLLPFFPWFGKSGCLAGWGRKPGVPPTSPPPSGRQKSLLRCNKVVQDLSCFRIFHHAANGNGDDQIVTAFTCFVFSFSMGTISSPIALLIP